MPRNGSGVYSKPAGTTAVPNTTIESAKYNSTIDDIAADLNLARPIVAGGTGATNATSARDNLGLEIGVDILGINYAPPGHLYGLTLANNGADATNDIDISTGSAASDGTTPALMTLVSSLTKRLDAAWAVGTNAGGLDTGSIANGTYHVWLIQRSDTGVVDALFSASATSPTMPPNYDRKRRIGSILRESGSIVAFRQNGDYFKRVTPLNVASATASVADQLFYCGVPLGIVCSPFFRWAVVTSANGQYSAGLGSGAESASTQIISVGTNTTPSFRNIWAVPPGMFFTDTSGRLWIDRSNVAGTVLQSTLDLLGYVDTRGRV